MTIQLQEVAEKSEVSILDLTGRLIKTTAITSNNSSIDVQELSKGIYIVRVATTNQVGVKRFIKNKGNIQGFTFLNLSHNSSISNFCPQK